MEQILPGANYAVGFLAYFNDKKQEAALVQCVQLLPKKKNYQYIPYKNIIGYELLDDGKPVTSGGLGRAVVGGVIAGGAGAIVGAITGRKTKEMSENLRVKVLVKNMSRSYFNCPLLVSKVSKDSGLYKSAIKDGKALCQKLDSIISKNQVKELKPRTPSDPTELLRKYKALVDEGVITQEDFEKKKN